MTATAEWIRLQTSILHIRNACAGPQFARLRGAAAGFTPRSPIEPMRRVREQAERVVEFLSIKAPTAQRFQVVMLDGSRELLGTVEHATPITAARAEALVMLRNPGRRVVKVKALGGAL